MILLAAAPRKAVGSKTDPVEMSQFTSVSISAFVFGSVLFVSDKSGCLSSFCSLSNESFPLVTSDLMTLRNSLKTVYSLCRGHCMFVPYGKKNEYIDRHSYPKFILK